MLGISEALVATAVGLLVAIPATVAYNAFSGRLRQVMSDTDLLGRTLLSVLKREPVAPGLGLTPSPRLFALDGAHAEAR
jgi:biopolymer transport protein ExbB